MYGPNIPREKNQFLEEIHNTSTLVGSTYWKEGGDFNMITSLKDKKGGIRRLETYSLAFCQLIHDLKVVDLETNNGIYTWNNKRGGKNQIASRLDRYLLSENIMQEN